MRLAILLLGTILFALGLILVSVVRSTVGYFIVSPRTAPPAHIAEVNNLSARNGYRHRERSRGSKGLEACGGDGSHNEEEGEEEEDDDDEGATSTSYFEATLVKIEKLLIQFYANVFVLSWSGVLCFRGVRPSFAYRDHSGEGEPRDHSFRSTSYEGNEEEKEEEERGDGKGRGPGHPSHRRYPSNVRATRRQRSRLRTKYRVFVSNHTSMIDVMVLLSAQVGH